MNRSLKSLAVVALLMLLCQANTLWAQNNSQQLQGAWLMTTVDPPAGAGPTRPLNALALFNRDGGSQTTAAVTNPPGIIQSEGLGEWVRTAENEFVVTWMYTNALVLDAQGNAVDLGLFRIQVKLSYNADRTQLSGPVKFAALDLNGSVLFSGESAVVLKRIPLPSF